MKISKFLFAILLFSTIFTACDNDDNNGPKDTTVSGGEVSGVWKAGSTITILGHIQVPTGKSLIIEEGVKVLMSDTAIGQEILVYGNLYCRGTASNPITFTVPENLRKPGEFPRIWGGIICAPSCKELLMLYTEMSYTGYVTTEDSPSVLAGLFKGVAGEGLPAVNFRNEVDGKVVVEHCTFHHLGEDCLYLEGGSYIVAYNTVYTQGETGGDCFDLKSGSIADIAFNLVFSPNTNALKLSNAGDRVPQCDVIGYNNTIVNGGWRRPTVKGGGVWLENSVLAEIYNTLHINCRFGIKNSKADDRCKYDSNYYYGYDQETVDNFQPTTKDVVRGPHDVGGTLAGENDPKVKNFPLNTDKYSASFNTSWDFHPTAGSPTIGAGTIDFAPHFSATGLTLDGQLFTSPAPSTTVGAFGAN